MPAPRRGIAEGTERNGKSEIRALTERFCQVTAIAMTIRSAMTSLPPVSRAGYSSRPAASKVIGVFRRQRSSADSSSVSDYPVDGIAQPTCSTITPLGCPVEPEVYIT